MKIVLDQAEIERIIALYVREMLNLSEEDQIKVTNFWVYNLEIDLEPNKHLNQ